MTVDFENYKDFIDYIDDSKSGALFERGLVKDALQSAIDAFSAFKREFEYEKEDKNDK